MNFVLRPLLFCIGVMPRRCLCWLSDVLALLAGGVIGYRRKVVLSNLRKAFPDKGSRELRRIARSSYRNFFDLMLNIFRVRYASDRRVRRTVKLRNFELFDELYRKGKSGVVLAAHYSCWEYIGIASACSAHQTVAAYQPLSFAPLEKIIAEARSRYGAILAALRDVFRVLLEYQKNGKLTMALMVSDQSPAAGSCQHWVELLGQPTPVLVGPERIAQKLRSAVMYLRVHVVRRFQYEYELVLLSDDASQEAPLAVTKRFYAALEQDLRRAPQYWMWTHKRWKNQRLYPGTLG